jgi:hypothetical protein
VQVPQTAVSKVSIQHFQPNANVVLPSLSLGPLQLPSGSASDIQTVAGIGFLGIASSDSAGFGFGPVSASISITPTAWVSIGSLQLQNVKLSGSVVQAILSNIGVPIDVQGINLKTIGIGQVDVSNITL